MYSSHINSDLGGPDSSTSLACGQEVSLALIELGQFRFLILVQANCHFGTCFSPDAAALLSPGI